MLQSHLSSSSKGISMLVTFFSSLFSFVLFSCGSRTLRGYQGDGGKKGLCSWSFDTVYFGRGQLIIIQLTPCFFVLTPLYSALHSHQIDGFLLFFWSMYFKDPWFFLGSFFLYSFYSSISLLPSFRFLASLVCLSAFGVFIYPSTHQEGTSVLDRYQVFGASIFFFFFFSSLLVFIFSFIHDFVLCFLFFFKFFF
ncbi:hypothetical protein L873DRAFT_384306 [Choiromyces venosus 120613-1]|uniref:Uncharacterized protein n=1 Tax=Choiromyces venosus 120613-1 TaxID=1336337 RepID=A0A3N4IY42_9PEZI|nr:hypothetical protein L873DRAFT_384306 [Choiromyces venosus 120613-1]